MSKPSQDVISRARPDSPGRRARNLKVQGLSDSLALVQTHASVVDKNGVETVTDSLLHELGGNGGVDTTTNGTENVIGLTHQLPNPKNFLIDELRHGPIGIGTTNADGEVAEELGSIGGVLRLVRPSCTLPTIERKDHTVTSGWN